MISQKSNTKEMPENIVKKIFAEIFGEKKIFAKKNCHQKKICRKKFVEKKNFRKKNLSEKKIWNKFKKIKIWKFYNFNFVNLFYILKKIRLIH